MDASDWISICGIAIGFLLFLIPVVYFAGKIVGKMETLIGKVSSLEAKVEAFGNNCFTKKEAEDASRDLGTLWKKLDAIKKVVLRLAIKADEDITKTDL